MIKGNRKEGKKKKRGKGEKKKRKNQGKNNDKIMFLRAKNIYFPQIFMVPTLVEEKYKFGKGGGGNMIFCGNICPKKVTSEFLVNEILA